MARKDATRFIRLALEYGRLAAVRASKDADLAASSAENAERMIERAKRAIFRARVAGATPAELERLEQSLQWAEDRLLARSGVGK